MLLSYKILVNKTTARDLLDFFEKNVIFKERCFFVFFFTRRAAEFAMLESSWNSKPAVLQLMRYERVSHAN